MCIFWFIFYYITVHGARNAKINTYTFQRRKCKCNTLFSWTTRQV